MVSLDLEHKIDFDICTAPVVIYIRKETPSPNISATGRFLQTFIELEIGGGAALRVSLDCDVILHVLRSLREKCEFHLKVKLREFFKRIIIGSRADRCRISNASGRRPSVAPADQLRLAGPVECLWLFVETT